MSKRFVTYAGVPVPPFKEDKIGAGSTTIRFVLVGNIISKKNNQQAIAVRSFSKKYIFDNQKNGMVSVSDAIKAINMVKGKMRGNAKYLEFLEKQKPFVIKQMQEWSSRLSSKGLIFPIPKSTLTVRLYIKDRYRRDTINAMQTISDLLVDSGVIYDDDDTNLISVFGKAARYHEELVNNIAFISLSFKL